MSDHIDAWLAAQREITERWFAAPVPPVVNSAEQTPQFWQTIIQGLSPQAQELARQLAELAPGLVSTASDAVFELFGNRSSPGPTPPFARWLDLAPVGYFREHQAHAQQLSRALGDYQRIAGQMSAAIAKIHSDALELLTAKVESLANNGESVTDTRRLYELWIECGEQAFAQHSRGEVFGLLQGELVNAGTRLRIAQQTIAEAFLKSLDLPTRAELNSTHKRLKELRERIESLEAAVDKSATRSKR